MNLEKLKNKLENLKNKKTDNNHDNRLLRFSDGKNVIRILPPKEEDEEFYHEVMVHNLNIGGKYNPVTCLGDNCPICEVRQELWALHNAATGNAKGAKSKYGTAAAAIKKATPKFLMNVVDKRKKLTGKDGDEDNPDFESVKVVAATNLLFTAIITSMVQEDEDTGELEYGDITKTDKGHDFYVMRQKGENDFYNFNGSQPKPKTSPAGSAKDIARWMDECYDLSEIIPLDSYETVKNIAQKLSAGLISSSASTGVDNEEEDHSEEESDDESFVQGLKD